MKRFPAFLVSPAFFIILFLNGFAPAQEHNPIGERIVMCMIQLQHADAEELADVLQPFLSSAGSIVPYRPTNTLIIKDRASVVDKLSIIIKGKPCTPFADPSDAEKDDAAN